jgi:hypothetical protein
MFNFLNVPLNYFLDRPFFSDAVHQRFDSGIIAKAKDNLLETSLLSSSSN